MPTFLQRIQSSINDAREHPTNTWSHTLSNLFIDDPGQRHSYVQWQPGIVKGSTVTSATLSLTASVALSISVPAPTLQVDRVNDVSNTLDNDLSGVGTTGDGLQFGIGAWDLDSEYQFDITSIVQAWINRANYVSTDYLTLYLNCLLYDMRAYAWDGDPDKAAQIQIVYDEPADVTPDPFTRVYNAVWTMLEASPSLTSLVKTGNRIKLIGDDNSSRAEKDTLHDADVPEIQVRMIGGQVNLDHSSSTSTISSRIEIQLRTGSWQYDYGKFMETRFAIYRAMANWKAAFNVLTWKNTTFVLDLMAPTLSDGVTQKDQDNDRGLKGWATVWTAEVRMQFPIANLQE